MSTALLQTTCFEDLHLLGDAAERGILGRSPQTLLQLARLQEEVQQRYIDLVVRPKEKSVRHELAITKAESVSESCMRTH